MNRTFKSFSLVILALLLCISTLIPALASSNIPAATSNFYVNDFANVFTVEEKAKLMDNAVSLANEHDGIQVVVTTIKSLNGDSVENYALNMYNQYGIGKNDMGLLILLSTEDRKVRVEVGKAMEEYINDSKAGRIMDKHAIPLLKENKFNEGLIALQTALINEIITCVTSKSNAAPSSNANSTSPADFALLFGICGILLLLVLLIYIVMLISKKIKSRKEHIENLEQEINELISKNKELTSNYEYETNKLTDCINSLKDQNRSLEADIEALEDKLSDKQARHDRALKIYPDVDKKIDAIITQEIIESDKKAAATIDSLICSVINLAPSKDIVGKLHSVLSKYSSLSAAQKKYIISDVQKLQMLYAKSSRLKEDYEKKLEEERIAKLTQERKSKAQKVTKEILAIISGIGFARAHDLYKLNDAKGLFDDLDHETQKYVDSSVISKLNDLICAAKRDKEEEEEAERRRRQSYYHSSSSHSSSSFGGFSGFGGSSGGGGASRGF